jgi:hypothetical protein
MQDFTIGSYNLISENQPAEGDITIRLKPIDLITYWKRCGTLANFMAAFYAYTLETPMELENSISTVFNELIENATKYSVKKEAEVSIKMMLYDTVLKMQIENITTEHHFKKFQAHFRKLIEANDLEEAYFEALIKKADEKYDSGIGLLLIMKDYPIKMGVRFIEDAKGKFKIITQTFFFIN